MVGRSCLHLVKKCKMKLSSRDLLDLLDRNKVLGLNLVAIYRDVQEEETVFTLKAKSDVTDFYRQMNRQLSLIDQIFILFSSLPKPSVQ